MDYELGCALDLSVEAFARKIYRGTDIFGPVSVSKPNLLKKSRLADLEYADRTGVNPDMARMIVACLGELAMRRLS
jgi:hypothetical protein